MKIEIMPNYEKLSQAAARFVVQQVLMEPRSVLALPTGRTPMLMYDLLVFLYKRGMLDLVRTTVFNLDEFIGLPATHNMSYNFYLEELFAVVTT